MTSFWKILGIVAAAVIGVLLILYVVVPLACVVIAVLWAAAGALAFIAKLVLFAGLFVLVGFLVLRAIVRGIEMLLY